MWSIPKEPSPFPAYPSHTQRSPPFYPDKVLRQPFQPLLEERLIRVLLLTSRHLSWTDLITCSLLNKNMSRAIRREQWRQPQFDQGRIHDSLYHFIQFIDALPTMSEFTRQCILHINVNNVEESLYGRVPTYFFKALVDYCPRLETLTMRRCTFFKASCLKLLDKAWQLDHVTHLDISHCDHVTDAMLYDLAQGLPHLEELIVDHTPVSGLGIAAMAAQCDKLREMSLSHTDIDDTGLAAIAKFRTIHLRTITLDECRKITPAGLDALAKYNVHLQTLRLARTTMQSGPLAKLLQRSGPSNTLRCLDISECPQLETPQMAEALLRSRLQHLTISMNMAQQCLDLRNKQLLPDAMVNSSITLLTIEHLPEWTPLDFMSAIVRLFAGLKRLVLTRHYYEDDFIYGQYTDLTHAADRDTLIHSHTVQAFNQQQSAVQVELQNIREAVHSLDMSQW